MPVYDSRAINGRNSELISLNQGLDLTTTPTQRAPGSLLEAINVELVDGVLQGINGTIILGESKFNQLSTDIAILNNDDTSEYTLTGTVTDFEKVNYYTTNYAGIEPDGSGYWWSVFDTNAAVGYKNPIAIVQCEGASPEDAEFFVGEDSGATVDISSLSHTKGFKYTSRYTSVSSETYNLLWEAYQRDIKNSLAWDGFRPGPPRDGDASHVFQLNDDTYAVVDFPVLYFRLGTEEPSIGDKIQVDKLSGTDPTFYVARAELVDGSWDGGDAEGWLYLYPQSDSTLAEGYDLKFASSVNINNLTTTNKLGETETQTSPATVQNIREHGLLWKLDTSGRVNTGWKYVDMGYSVQYDNGAVAPLSTESPVFVTDSLEVVQETGFSYMTSPATEFPLTGTFSAWAGLGNVAADDATYATTTLAIGDKSRNMVLTPAASGLSGDAKIIGIEVAFEASVSAGSSAVINKVQLRKATTAGLDPPGTEYYSANRGDNAVLATTPGTHTYGGQLDLWGFDEITQADFNNQDIEIVIQFEEDGTAAGRIVSVDYVQINVHYLQNGQDVYFYDGSADVATGTLYSYQVHDGEWSTDDAKGYMTCSTITNPSACVAGIAIRSAASGGGDQIATVVETTKNILPGYYELEAVGSRCQELQSNIGGGEEDSKVFVTNGVSPCFSVDHNDVFQFIRTPVDPTKDNPRYVAEISEHLMLGLKEHVFVSSIATPNNFSTYDGATVWSTGDEITGLVAAPGNSVIVLSMDSVHILGGSGASGDDPFNLQRHSTTTGARHYSGVYANGVLYLDNHGLTSLSTSDKFGDFDAGKLSYAVEEWIRNRLLDHTTDEKTGITGFLEAIPCRTKNQIRMYFNDGWVLTASFPPEGSQDPRPQFTMQNYAWVVEPWAEEHVSEGIVPVFDDDTKPFCISSQASENGRERIVMGVKGGLVNLLEQSCVRDGNDSLHGTFVLNHLHSPNPLESTEKYVGCVLSFERDFTSNIWMTTGIDWNSPPHSISDGDQVAGTTVSQDDLYKNRYIVSQADYFDNEMSSAVAYRVRYDTDDGLFPRPTKYIAVAPRRSAKGSRKANTQRSVSDTTG